MNYLLNDVSLIYDHEKAGGTAALKNVTLSLDKIEFIGIKGPSGSGKSTLLYTMAGLKKPTFGTVLYGGTNLFSLGPAKLASLRRKEFGFIFQQHFLIHYLTVLENVLVPLNSNNKSAKNKAIKLLERLGIADYAYKYPYQLSGGQNQRAAIARSLISEPKVIFGDEPTAALDRKSALEVIKLLSEYTNHTMIILVTHDDSLLTYADKVISISDGSILNISNTGGRK